MDIDEQKSKTSEILFCSTIVLMGLDALQEVLLMDARFRNYKTKDR
jgi:hypothetical protein